MDCAARVLGGLVPVANAVALAAWLAGARSARPGRFAALTAGSAALVLGASAITLGTLAWRARRVGPEARARVLAEALSEGGKLRGVRGARGRLACRRDALAPP